MSLSIKQRTHIFRRRRVVLAALDFFSSTVVIADALNCRPATVLRDLKSMEAQGMVQRKGAPGNVRWSRCSQ